MSFSLPQLEYSYEALLPAIDAQTMEIHHQQHHRGYVDKLNQALVEHPVFNSMAIEELLQSLEQLPKEIRTTARNNGGGHANHSLFWTIMSPEGGGLPQEELASEIKATFGSYKHFQRQFNDAALSCFGSGWAWLTVDAEHKLAIESTVNQNSPLMSGSKPILGLDVWEHAYCLKYQNRRADYVSAWWGVVNWANVARWYNEDWNPVADHRTLALSRVSE